MAHALFCRSHEESIVGLLTFTHPDISIRPVNATDDSFCHALFHDNRSVDFARLNLDNAMLTMLLDQQFRAQQASYRQAFPKADDLIIARSGEAVGRLMLVRCDSMTVHVIDIVLSTHARGRGIGTDVLSGLDRAASAIGAARLTLSVLSGNSGARRLYERLGFYATGDDGARIAMVKELA